MWWLDWCCSENSKYSANGVTPDAFINQQYAKYTDEALGGRGLAFSRAYGSLTAGGYGNPQAVPTGPVGGQAHHRALHRRHHVVVGHAARRGRLHPR